MQLNYKKNQPYVNYCCALYVVSDNLDYLRLGALCKP